MLPEIQLSTIKNLNYVLIGRNDLISNAVISGGFEDHLKLISNEILKNTKDGIVLDIGANMGSYTIPLAAEHPHLQIYSFEPQRVVFYQLCTNILLNRLDNIFAYNQGISDSIWTKFLEVPDYNNESNIGAFSVEDDVRAKDYLVVTKGGLEQINAVPLDTMQLKNIRLIKIDVEGHELAVLHGAKETLKFSNYPPILFEAWNNKLSYKKEAVFKYLNDIGYAITKIDAIDNYIAIKKPGEVI